MPTESANHLRQPDDLPTAWLRFLALRPRLAAGVLLSSDASGPSVVPSVRATCVPVEARTVTALTQHDLTFSQLRSLMVAWWHFAAAPEQRDGVALFDGQFDRLSAF